MHYPDLILKAEGIIINGHRIHVSMRSNVLFGQFLLCKNNIHFQICIWFCFMETMSIKGCMLEVFAEMLSKHNTHFNETPHAYKLNNKLNRPTSARKTTKSIDFHRNN